MNDRRVPVPKKWPFYVADAFLLAFAIWLLNHYPHPLTFATACLMGAAVLLAAFLGIMPFRMEHQAAVKFAEAEGLADAMATLRKLETVSDQIKTATGQWQGVQEQASRTVSSSKEIADRIAAEAHSFAEFMQKANDSEKAALRLETEKLRRGEGQWLQVLVHLLDHVYALYQAGARSGQPNLQEQLASFQEACRDIARRVGLTPFEAAPNEPFDGERHQLPEDQPAPPSEARVAQNLATGYTFQGRLLRRSLVALLADGQVVENNQATESASTNELIQAEDFLQTADSSAADLATLTGTEGVEPVENVGRMENIETVDVVGESASAEVDFSAADLRGAELTEGVNAQPAPASLETEQEFRLESDPLDAGQDDRRRA
jgi:molecular chaperone GrpE (heat shock protein)